MHHKNRRLEAQAVTTAEFILPDDSRWAQMLRDVRHDFYHLPQYIELCSEQEGGTAAAFYAETDHNIFLVPLLIRNIPFASRLEGTERDLVTPYGYPSPLLLDPCDPNALAQFMTAFQWAAMERNFVSAFFRLHPLLPLPDRVLREHGEVVKHGETVSIDLSLPEQTLWRQIRRDRRGCIKKLLGQGYHVVMDEWGALDEFIQIYMETMQRVNAKAFYYFPRSYFTGLRAALGERLHLCLVVSPSGRVAAASLFTLTDGIIQLHLSGTAAEYCHLGPSKLMLHEISLMGKSAGARIMHLGGGVGGRRDSLFEFKAAFSPLRNSFSTYRMILQEERYHELVRVWKKEHKNLPLSSDYFPLYRYSA